jgi:hypothetical protein
MKKFTHKGIQDSRILGASGRNWIRLRETANFWVDRHGTKYRKTTGSVPNDEWCKISLEIDSIKPLAVPSSL